MNDNGALDTPVVSAVLQSQSRVPLLDRSVFRRMEGGFGNSGSGGGPELNSPYIGWPTSNEVDESPHRPAFGTVEIEVRRDRREHLAMNCNAVSDTAGIDDSERSCYSLVVRTTWDSVHRDVV